MTRLPIQIVSDVVCPWCLIGYKYLEQALEAVPQVTPEITWHSFELNPRMPLGGQNLAEHMAEKYGSTSGESDSVRERLRTLGREVGFQFHFNQEMRIYNTLRCHQLLHWARETGKQTPLKLAFFDSYFTRNEAVDQIEVLAEVAQRAGLDGAEATRVLEESRYEVEVRDEEKRWHREGVNAVPTVVIGNDYVITGARPAKEIVPALQRLVVARPDSSTLHPT